MIYSSSEKILDAQIEEKYSGAVEKLENYSTSRDRKEISANFTCYLQKEWLPHMKLCVKARANSIRHLCMDDTSPVKFARAGLEA